MEDDVEKDVGTRSNPGLFDCEAIALDDEPKFTLLGRDENAPGIVEAWADQRELFISRGYCPVSDMEKVEEARYCAKRMRWWRKHNMGAWRRHK